MTKYSLSYSESRAYQIQRTKGMKQIIPIEAKEFQKSFQRH